MKVSPKAAAAFLAPLVLGLVAYLLTGNEQFLFLALGAPIAGGGAFAAPPAPRVKQAEVERLSRQRAPAPFAGRGP